MDFRILGPIDVRGSDGAVALGGNKPRAVLAVLLLHANEPVTAERLALALWGEDAPGGAVKTVQVHVSRLRKALGDPDIVATTAAGYTLRVGPDELDAQRFERLVEEGRQELASGQPEHAATTLREALGLWRGPPLAELAGEPFAATEIARLEEQRLAALETRVEADLAADRHDQLVGELQGLVADNPIRERLAGQLMLALYRCGRQSEALEAYAEARRTLVSEIGVEPGPELRRLQEAILRQDDALEPRAPVADLPMQLETATAPLLAGRDAELAWLQERWQLAASGAGALVVLTGEAGSGRTRLAAELAGEAHRLGASVLYAPGAGRAEVTLASLDRAGETTRPMLVIVDDADRAGADVRARLASLPAALADVPALVLATGADAGWSAQLGAHETLALPALGEEAIATIAAGYAPGGDPAGVPIEWLRDGSGGNPKRVHELAGQWARREAARKVGAVAGRAAAGRAELRSVEAELTGDVVQLQAARERTLVASVEDGPVVCPFKGLASFDVADAPYFFGREQLVAELVARLVGASLLAVVGPSGSGKSSVTRAGLLPALASGVLPGSDGWTQVLIRPGEHPEHTLRAATASLHRGEHIVIAVDQFEETFTTCRDEEERAAFIAELVRAATDGSGRTTVVIALRADFYGRCADYPGLSELVATNHVLVGPMRRDELRRAVERPAARVGLIVDPELSDALVADVKDEPGALPLLSTALLELWQRRDGRRLRYETYERSGGVKGAVARLAEDAFGQLDAAQQTIGRGVLMRLAGEGAAGTVERRRVSLTELEIERDEDVGRVVALLTDRRLLSVDEGTIEFAHEALLREWPRLRDWIDEDRDGLRIQRGLSAAALEWERLGREDGTLFRGARLAELREWRAARSPSLNALERDFLEGSEARDARERTQRRRRLVAAFGGLAIVIVAISIVAVVSISESRTAKRQRDVVASRDLAVRSADTLASDPALALALGQEALTRAKTEQAQSALRQATLADRTRAIWSALGWGNGYALALSPDRRLLAAGYDDGVRVRRVDDGRVIRTIKSPGTAALGMGFSPDGRRIALATAGGDVMVAAVGGGPARVVLHRTGEDRVPLSAEFSPDGHRLLVGTNDGSVGFVPATGGSALQPLPGTGDEAAAAHFSSDGTKVVATNGAGARVWSVGGGAPLTLSQPVAAHAAVFDRAARRVATAGDDGKVRIWDLRRPEVPLRTIPVSSGALGKVAFSADGRQLVTVGQDEVVRVVDADGGPPLAELVGHTAPGSDALFLHGSNDVASIAYDGTVRRWGLLPVTLTSGLKLSGSPSFGPHGRVVSGYADGTVRIWDPAGGQLTELEHYTAPSKASYSADGQHVISSSEAGDVRLWSAASGRSRRVSSSGKEVYGLAVDRSGARVAIATLDGPTVVERPDGTGLVTLAKPGPEANALAFSPDGKHIVGAFENNTARIWNATTGKQERVLKHDATVFDARYSRDGRFIVTGAGDGTVRVWPLGGGPPVLLTGHRGEVNGVAFDPTGTRVLSAGNDGTVRVWNATGGDALVVLVTHRGGALGATFNSRGDSVLSSGADRTIRITRCEVCGSLADVLKLARSRPARQLTADERRRLLPDSG